MGGACPNRGADLDQPALRPAAVLSSPRCASYPHATFGIYSLRFVTLLVVGLIGLGLLGVPGNWLRLAFVVAAPIHLYRHLKDGYRLDRGATLWRTAVLLLFTAFTSTLFALFLPWLETK